jgi:GNAT superfamily N-acetyltransferase
MHSKIRRCDSKFMKAQEIIMVQPSLSGPHMGRSSDCEPVLRALPQWFGIEEAIVHYLKSIDEMPTWVANVREQMVGFVTIKQHSTFSAEVYVMAVLPDWHRSGIGRLLLQEVESYLWTNGTEFLQVKTLSAKHPDGGYAKTRAFYTAMGFKPLEEFEDLWDGIPCLQLIKHL